VSNPFVWKEYAVTRRERSAGRALEIHDGVGQRADVSGKDSQMWVFDGEEWTEEGRSREERASEASLPMWDETMPELQVIEHIPSTTRTNTIPLPPLP
jgi:hypothetical protein